MIENGINQDIIQQMNRRLIIRLLRKKGNCSRAELARWSKLKPATITNIINEFLELGLVKETGIIKTKKGRNAVGLSLSSREYKIIALRLSRKYFILGLFDISGNELSSAKYDILENDTSQDAFEKIKKQIRALINNCKEGQIIAIGCAIPGPFLRTEGKVALMSGFPNWQDIRIKTELEKEFDIPVNLEHDANVGALAYYWKLGAQKNETLLYIDAGQGIGAGILNNGELVVGALGIAGEIGHMTIEYNGVFCECGNRGCLEKYCSSIALTKAINKKIEEDNYSILKSNSTFNEITDAIRKDDKLAVSEYRKACEILGIGIVNILNIFNPNIIVIGDEMPMVSPEIMQESIEKIVKARVLKDIWDSTKIIVIKEDNNIVLGGASIVATEEILKNPLLLEKKTDYDRDLNKI